MRECINPAHCQARSLPPAGSRAKSVQMLRAVVDGETYESVAERFAVTRVAVERRVKRLALELVRTVGIHGLSADSVGFVGRLRAQREAVHAALDAEKGLQPGSSDVPARGRRVLEPAEIEMAAARIRARSRHSWHDVALFYMLFCTAARPLEIARLQVRDYLHPDGTVRRQSEVRAEVSITGRSRALRFASARLDEALAHYLEERRTSGLGLGPHADAFRGLDPESPLFLSASGSGFRITPYGQPGQHRFLCRPILETYAKLFRYGDLHGVSALSARRTLIARLCERGADEGQIVSVLGMGERGITREVRALQRPTLDKLVDDLV